MDFPLLADFAVWAPSTGLVDIVQKGKNLNYLIFEWPLRENELQSLECKKSDHEYHSPHQCLISYFNSKDFSPCPIKCIPIQMQGTVKQGHLKYQYFHNLKIYEFSPNFRDVT